MRPTLYLPLFLESVFRALGRFKWRTFVIGLCITISVFATVLLPAVGDSLIHAVVAFNKRENRADAIVVYGNIGVDAGRTKNNLRIADVEAVRQAVPNISDVDIIARAGTRTVRSGARSTPVNLTGVSDRAPSIQRFSTERGVYFDAGAVGGRAHVAVIGKTAAASLFGTDSPLGKDITIDNMMFRIVGEQQHLGTGPHGNDLDDTLQIPYTTLMEHLLHVEFITGAKFILADAHLTATAAQDIRNVLRNRHRIEADAPDDFALLTPDFIQERVRTGEGVFLAFIIGTSTAAFLISIFIIASVTAVALKERTPEIGIRKAVGWAPNLIVLHIVLEVGCIGTIAAVAGVVLATITCPLITPLLAAKAGVTAVAPTAFQILIALMIGVLSSVVAAWLPAKKAARHDSITALRMGT